MVNIINKISTLREATAQAIVRVSKPETIEAIVKKSVPKGDVMEVARTAGLFAVKRTADMIPDCHPLPVEHTDVRYHITGLEIKIEITVRTVYKTGVEVEAMHGASVIALTMYDMLKPIDKSIEIASIRLVGKKGGKSAFGSSNGASLKAAVLVISDSISAGSKTDKAGKQIVDKLESLKIKINGYSVIPDEADQIRSRVIKLCEDGNDLVITTGGTGLSPRDVTPEAVKPILDREIPGIMEAARGYGQIRTPYAMLSRGVAGFRGDTLIITLPGSTRGTAESLEALFPYVLHLFKVKDGFRHDVAEVKSGN